MEYKDAKQKFIQAWGTLGSSWGINKAMAQIHALLLISKDPLSAEEVMEELQREIEPIIKVLEQVQGVTGSGSDVAEFKEVTNDLKDFSYKVDGVLDKFVKSDQNWFYKLLMKL